MEYEIIRSNIKRLTLTITEGRMKVNAPLKATDEDIRRFVEKNGEWIEQHLAESQEREREKDSIRRLTKEELAELKRRAEEAIPERVKVWSRIVGVTYGKITICAQRSRWGSCKSNGDLNFNCLLMLAPLPVLDSVVVHELCHRAFMNHKKNFYEKILRIFPDYYKCNEWLDENGWRLIAMISPTSEEKAAKKAARKTLSPEERSERKNAKRLAKLSELGQRIEELEKECAEYAAISLIGVRASVPQYGEGTVVRQELNRITIRFGDTEKSYILNEKYTIRPRFEDDERIIAAFTELARKRERIEELKREMEKMNG